MPANDAENDRSFETASKKREALDNPDAALTRLRSARAAKGRPARLKVPHLREWTLRRSSSLGGGRT